MTTNFILVVKLFCLLTFSFPNKNSALNPLAKEVISNQVSRIKDAYGSGHFGDSRDQNTRKHKGLDIITKVNENVFSPIDGELIRQAVPYKDDLSFKGVVINGKQDWIGYEIKIFYVDGLFSGNISAGQQIGFTQDLTKKYPGITNHIHIEVRYYGNPIDPFDLWKISF